ncbi:MAG TPA: hypothetical protein PLU10_04340 [Chitinophagaceae bacterium]|jgi:hypothetical protein|nr:hypothetical protein [Chitinophagaceae bacterium]
MAHKKDKSETIVDETIGGVTITEDTPIIEVAMTETIEEVAPIVNVTQFNLKPGQCAVKRKDGKGGICIVNEKYIGTKYSLDKYEVVESKKK